jgi:hypothetical protein
MRRALRLAGLVVASCLALAAPTAAATGQPDPQQPPQPSPGPIPNRKADFLFGRPKASIGVRGSWVFATAGSDLFDFVTRHLTLEKQDFNSPGFAFDLGIALGGRADVLAGFEMNRMAQGSEYRDYVDNNLLPIQQTTELKTWQVVGSLRYSLTPKGHDVSRLVWIPRRVVPYVGAGGGVIRYDFQQTGDFVDFQDLSVFFDSFQSQGWAPTAHVFGGVDLQIHRALYASVQARYTKAAGTLSSDFIDFDPIDLSGFHVSAGINLLF